MSIASNVIEENNRLATARSLLREKLTLNNVHWEDSDTIFELLARWANTNDDLIIGYIRPNSCFAGNTVDFGAKITIYDDNDDEVGVSNVPVTITINGQTRTVLTDNNGIAKQSVTVGAIGSSIEATVYAGTDSNTWSYEAISFYFSEDSKTVDSYTVVKHPSSATLTSRSYEFDSNYNDYGVKVSKEVASTSAIYLIPTDLINGIDATEYGIHMQAKIVVKYGSSSGWACGIGLLANKSLSHYRDTNILELGAYTGKKGLRYSTSDHVIRDLNVTSGQLTLNSLWYTFDLYYKDGNIKATIKNGSTTVYSYEGTTLTFETAYPFLTIYDYGGQMIFNNVTVEEWDGE